jgi:agmatinase
MQFLGSELKEEENQKEHSRFQVIPCPMEKTVSYGAGTSGGPKAILEASLELERSSICEQGIFTQQEIDCSADHKACLSELRDRVGEVVEAKKMPIVLGGEHSLSWAAVNGVADVLGQKIGIIQMDAHADLRENYEGNPHSHASVMNLLVAEGQACFFGGSSTL